MTGRSLAALVPFGLLLATLAVASADAPVNLRDAGGREIHLDRAPRRIITLLPSLTETVCALGECARLIATDRYSNWPPSINLLPKAGGFEDAEIEQIVSLKPDVVLLGDAKRVSDRLRQLGVPTFDVETRTYADIARTVSTIGLLLGVPQRASALSLQIESSVEAVADETSSSLHGRSPLVYYEVDSGPYAAGPESFIGELLSRLGARNVLSRNLGLFPKLNPEYVVRHNPEVIFVSPEEAPNLMHRPGWDQIRAVKEQRLCSFPPEVRDMIVRPGPRVAEGLRALAACLIRVAP